MISSFPAAARVLCLALVGAAVLASPPRASAQTRIRAPELVGGTGWLGTDQAIQLKDLRGKVVVFDFWTLC